MAYRLFNKKTTNDTPVQKSPNTLKTGGKKGENLVIIDFNNFLFKTMYVADRNFKREDLDPLTNRQGFINLIMYEFNSLVKKFSGNIIIARDGKQADLWRTTDEYPVYKLHRYKQNTYDAFWQIWGEEEENVIATMMSSGNVGVVSVPELEADDIIHILAVQESMYYEKIVVVSNDGDLVQIKNHIDNMLQYSPIDMKLIKCTDPNMKLLEKIVTGDAKDNVKHIGSIKKYSKQMIAYFMEEKDNQYTEEEVYDWLHSVERSDVNRFRMYVNKYKKAHAHLKGPAKKVFSNSNQVKFDKTILEQFRIGGIDKTKEFIYNNYEDWVYENYLLNETLIDFSNIPEKFYPIVKEQLVGAFKNKKTKREMFFISNKYKK